MQQKNALDRDYKSSAAGKLRAPFKRTGLHTAIIAAGLIGGATAFLGTEDAHATRDSRLPTETESRTEARAEPSAPLPASAAPDWRDVEVQAGDSLSRIFDRMGLTPQHLSAVLESGEEAQMLARLRPGEKLRFDIQDEELRALRYEPGPTTLLSITGDDGQFTSALTERPTDVKTVSRGAVIETSLYQSAQDAGVPDPVIMQLAEIFGWDIDFSNEIRTGDRFNVLYETRHIDGEEIGTGPILAASFVNRGKEYRTIRFTDAGGRTDYYTPDGRTMRKAFLRSPVDFRRISSRFQKQRHHPVLGVKRPHRGVDFAAAIGTPIKAAGDGKVIFRGRKGGYGNAVILSHGNGYTTLYGHMSRFRKDVKRGDRVKQGQLIGYVGKTGLASGPHLHYEFRINGAHRNPMTVDLPDAAPIDARYRADFEQSVRPLLAQLNSEDRKALASAEQEDGAF